MRISVKILSVLFFIAFFGQAQASVSAVMAKITSLYTNILCHELGHATVNKILFNDPIDMQAGIFTPVTLVNNSAAKIKLGLLPISGFAKVHPQPLKTKAEKLKMLAVILAGPLSGSLSSLILKNFIETCLPMTKFTKELVLEFKLLTIGSWIEFLPIKLSFIKTDGWQAIKLIFSLMENKEVTL
ncbi:MAG: hypothetical protein ACOYT8_03915 [Candidatus Dependentiae bacterium]